MKVLITGTAGFIGFHLARHLLNRGDKVIGYDNVNEYYDVTLKESRMNVLDEYDDYTFYKADICNREELDRVVKEHRPDKFCNLAAQAGVRYSLEHPRTYIDSNLVGFLNVLETCRHNGVKDLVYASSSSVYGGNTKVPFSVEDNVDSPISLYAATKKSNELMAHVYSHLFGMNTTGLRFFTVYGPYGRPDMALFKFTKAIKEGEAIDVFNFGKMERDFTYVDDIVSGITACLERPFKYEVFNLGNNRPADLEYFISLIEKELGKEAKKNYMPLQPGDVPKTYADIDHSKDLLGYEPGTTLEEGIHKFIEWYNEYYGS